MLLCKCISSQSLRKADSDLVAVSPLAPPSSACGSNNDERKLGMDVLNPVVVVVYRYITLLMKGSYQDRISYQQRNTRSTYVSILIGHCDNSREVRRQERLSTTLAISLTGTSNLAFQQNAQTSNGGAMYTNLSRQ